MSPKKSNPKANILMKRSKANTKVNTVFKVEKGDASVSTRPFIASIIVLPSTNTSIILS